MSAYHTFGWGVIVTSLIFFGINVIPKGEPNFLLGAIASIILAIGLAMETYDERRQKFDGQLTFVSVFLTLAMILFLRYEKEKRKGAMVSYLVPFVFGLIIIGVARLRAGGRQSSEQSNALQGY